MILMSREVAVTVTKPLSSAANPQSSPSPRSGIRRRLRRWWDKLKRYGRAALDLNGLLHLGLASPAAILLLASPQTIVGSHAPGDPSQTLAMLALGGALMSPGF